jgi:transposase-like protein
MGATKGGTRRRHSDEFKAAVLVACRQPGKSIAGVALKHGLNANMVRAWLRKSQQLPVCHSIARPASSAALGSAPQQFVPVCQHGRPACVQGQVRQAFTGHTT